MEFVKLQEADGSWAVFEDDWRTQCEALGEDFDSYAEATFTVVKDLIINQHKNAGVYALRGDEGQFLAMCQINKAGLPKYKTPALRVRFITLSPNFDLTDKDINDYADVLIELLVRVLELSMFDAVMEAMHINFHLRSPADQQFFRGFGKGLQERNVFESIQTVGAWLYITRKTLKSAPEANGER